MGGLLGGGGGGGRGGKRYERYVGPLSQVIGGPPPPLPTPMKYYHFFLDPICIYLYIIYDEFSLCNRVYTNFNMFKL